MSVVPHRDPEQTDATPPASINARKSRTHAWIVAAFNRLVLSRRYDALKVGDVAGRAGVGRSTFYEHFTGMDAVLREAVGRVVAPLASAVDRQDCEPGIRATLEHVAEHRLTTLRMLQGPASAQIMAALTTQIEHRLAAARRPGASTRPMLATAIASAQLGVVRAWLEAGAGTTPAAVLAHEIARITRAMVDDGVRAM